MKVKRVIFLCLILVTSLFWDVMAQPEAKIAFFQGDISFSSQKGYDLVSFPGCEFTSRVGEPRLPVKQLCFVLPPYQTVKGVVVKSKRQVELIGEFNIFPVQPPITLGFQTQSQELVLPKPEVYNSNEPYPQEAVRITSDGYSFGYHLVSVEVYPLQYIPSEKKLLLNEEIEFSFEMGGSQEGLTPVMKRRLRTQRQIERMIKGLVYNPETVDIYPNSPLHLVEEVKNIQGFDLEKVESSPDLVVEYVIITADSLASQFQPLADWRMREGIPAAIVTLSWIESHYWGCDLQEKIRNFIKDAYSNLGTVYVLLGGDTEIVPVRMGWGYYSGWVEVPTDVYYSAIDGNWNWDGDSHFGEDNQDDKFPDLFVGRLPARDRKSVENMVNKILKYEREPNTNYLMRMLLMGASVRDDGGDREGQTTKEAISSLSGIPDEMEIYKLYSHHEEYGGDAELDSGNVRRALNSGFGIVNHYDHGSKYGIDTGIKTGGGRLEIGDIDSLRNDYMPFIIFSFSCYCAAFNYDCIAEHFLLHPAGGALAFIGHSWSANTNQDYDDTLFFQALFDSLYFRIGETFWKTRLMTYGKESDEYLLYILTFLGDPGMPVWIHPPQKLFVNYPQEVLTQDTVFTITVKDSVTSTPVEGALVCLLKGEESYNFGYTDANGKVDFSLTPDTPGTLWVTVTAFCKGVDGEIKSYLPHQGYSIVESSTEAHLYLDNFTIYDGLSLGFEGNGDGVANAGETMGMIVSLGNGGEIAADSVWALFSTNSGWLDLIDSTVFFGDLPPEGVVTSSDTLVLKIDRNCPDRELLKFYIQLTDSLHRIWDDSLKLKAYAPELSHIGHFVDDEANNQADPGDTVRFGIRVGNYGWGAAKDVVAVLHSESFNITILSDSIYLGDIPSNSVLESDSGFKFILLDGYVAAEDSLEFLIKDHYGKVWVSGFELSPPDSVRDLEATGGMDFIDLEWTPNSDVDLMGYNVYRSDSLDGPFERVTLFPVGGVSYYQDKGLERMTSYFYLVTSVDSSGNESRFTVAKKAWTSMDYLEGWPVVTTSGRPHFSSPVISDVDSLSGMEVFIGCYLAKKLYGWHYNGVEIYDLDNDPNTVSGFAPTDGDIWGSPALGDLDGDGKKEVVVGSGNKLYAWHIDDRDGDDRPDSVSGWPVACPYMVGSPVIADLDGNGNAEVILEAGSGVYVFDRNGNTLPGWPKTGLGLLDYSTPAVADLDGDDSLEIIAAVGKKVYVLRHNGKSFPGNWPFSADSYTTPSPAVGDLNKDGTFEIVCASLYKIYVLEPNGSPMPGWEGGRSANLDLDYGNASSPVIGDINGDDSLEVVVSGASYLYAWSASGHPLPGWPIGFKGSWSSPALGDIDGDGDVEIIVGSGDKNVYAFHSDGSLLEGFPLITKDVINNSPAIGDLDGDGDLEIVVGSHDFMVHSWDCQGTSSSPMIEWGMFHHDYQHTGWYEFDPLGGIPDFPSDNLSLPQRVELYQNYPNPFNSNTAISYQLSAISDRRSTVSLKIYNIFGQRVKTLVEERQRLGYYIVIWNGRNDRGKNVASGVYLFRLKIGKFEAVKKGVLIR
jgi:hypothetical protein